MSLRILSPGGRLGSFVQSRGRVFAPRNFSGETAPAQVTKQSESSLEGAASGAVASSSSSLENVTRHGAGDGVICLDVGGKHFYTLRSTIASNPVLSDIVTRAEANGELTSHNNAIFVDRDPKHFGTILTYLRNKSEGLTFAKKATFKHKNQHVQLPQEKKLLAELYIEATYFQLDPLKDALCHHSIFTLFASMLGGVGNPFEAVASTAKMMRRAALALVAGGSIHLGSLGDIKLPAPVAKLLIAPGGDEGEANQPPEPASASS